MKSIRGERRGAVVRRHSARLRGSDGTHADSARMHRLRLAARPGPPVRVIATGAYERLRRTRVRVTAVADLAGQSAEVREGRRILGRGQLVGEGGRAVASVTCPMPAHGETWSELTVFVGGERATRSCGGSRSSGSRATLRIDSENELVIVMTRNAFGRNYAKYHPQFLKAIVDRLAR